MERMEKITRKHWLIIGLLCLCVLIYTLYHVASLFREDISTIAASTMTESDSISGQGYVFRNETVLYSSNDGVVDYLCEDGTRVSGGQALASVYEEGTLSERQLVRTIDHQIAVLEKSTELSAASADYDAARKDVGDRYYMLTRALAAGETGALSLQIDELLTGLNRLEVIRAEDGEPSAPQRTLEELYKMRAALLEASGTSVTESLDAGKTGYFYTDTDGYEAIFTEDAFQSLDAATFFRMISERPSAATRESGTPYGRLAESSRWGFVLEISFEEAGFFEEGETYAVEFTENHGVTLPMTLERKIGVSARSSVLLCLRCDRLPENFSFARNQSVRIETESVRGLYVPRKALVYDERDEAGVYILRGSVVQFRYVEIIYEGSDYYLVAEGVEGDGVRRYLSPNDLIILGGQNLFDGRILE